MRAKLPEIHEVIDRVAALHVAAEHAAAAAAAAAAAEGGSPAPPAGDGDGPVDGRAGPGRRSSLVAALAFAVAGPGGRGVRVSREL